MHISYICISTSFLLYSNKVLVIRSHVHFRGVCPATHILMLPRYNKSVLKTNWERDDVNTSDDGNGGRTVMCSMDNDVDNNECVCVCVVIKLISVGCLVCMNRTATWRRYGLAGNNIGVIQVGRIILRMLLFHCVLG